MFCTRMERKPRVSKEQGAVIGNEAKTVEGAAGESTKNLYASRYIPNIVYADGPAGLRITPSYVKYEKVNAEDAYNAETSYYFMQDDGEYVPADVTDEASYQNALSGEKELYSSDTYYQYCTAMPIGTLLAQTWDPEVVREVGDAVKVEMLEYGVTTWLAPGMNIHRNPLCGRNFEYYSEDPLITGMTAAAMTKGVQTNEDGSLSGVGVTVKHFAFNSQENERQGTNSVVSERAAREIYLKGFEIAVRTAKPDCVMSSYNMVDGYATFEHYGLLTEILRNEWGFDGFVMTDWYAMNTVYGVNKDKNVQGVMMYAGNDNEMPGSSEQSILAALDEGEEMCLGDLQRSAMNMLNVIKDSAVFDQMYQEVIEAEK